LWQQRYSGEEDATDLRTLAMDSHAESLLAGLLLLLKPLKLVISVSDVAEFLPTAQMFSFD
jgi:hypothetical protein